MIEAQVLNYTLEALISSAKQLDIISKKFTGSVLSKFGSDVAQLCVDVKMQLDGNSIEVSQHSLLFEDLAEICAGLNLQSIVIYLLGLGLKSMAMSLISYDDYKGNKTLDCSTVGVKKEVVDLENTPDNNSKTSRGRKIRIDSTKWLSTLECMLMDIRKDAVVTACLEQEMDSSYNFTLSDTLIVKGMLAAMETFVNTWKQSSRSSEIMALTEAVSEIESMILEQKYLVGLNPQEYNSGEMRINPGLRILATGFRSMIEALKNF